MDIFKQVFKASRDQFGSTEATKHKYVWECTRCTHKEPIKYEDGKMVVKPPVFCVVEHCSGTTFKLETVDT
jgi:hypothetical protein